MSTDPMIPCPRCFGRGYCPESRPNNRPGFYARNCPRCNGRGEIPEPAPRYSILTEIKRTGQPYDIRARDVGRLLSTDFGRVARGDIGKRVYLRDFGIAMENAEQRDARIAGSR